MDPSLALNNTMSSFIHMFHVFPSFELGGAQVRTTVLINSLKGIRHSIVTLNGRDDAKFLCAKDVEVEVLPVSPSLGMAARLRALYNLMRKDKPDLIVTYNWGGIEAVIVGTLSKIAPVIHIEDGFGTDEAVRLKRRRVLARRLLLRHTYRTIVPSRTLERTALQQYRLPPAKITYIPNGVDTSRFKPDSLHAPRDRAMQGPTTYGFVGQFRKEKNLDSLVRAFLAADLTNARLVLVGDGPCRPAIEQIIYESSGKGRVLLTGAVSDPLAMLQSFDVFVLPSLTEQMPLSLLEAMACGLPAFCTNVGDCSNMLKHPGFPWIANSPEEGDLAQGLRAVHSQRDLFLGIGTLNRKQCVARYSLDRMVNEHAGLYEEALGGKMNPNSRSGRTLAKDLR